MRLSRVFVIGAHRLGIGHYVSQALLHPTPAETFRAADDSHDEKKRRVQAALAAYVERFRGLGTTERTKQEVSNG